MSTFQSTNTLKGVAITAVLINHYLNANISGDSTGFANLIVAIFFIVSGYGVGFSLENRLNSTSVTIKRLSHFYLSRAAKIYPLYTIAYVIESLLFRRELSLWSVLGVHGPAHYWFIAAIIQCYLIAPAIFILIRKQRIFSMILMVAILLVSNLIICSNSIPPNITSTLNFVHLNWRDIYFFYIFVFCLSMLLPSCLHRWAEIIYSEKIIYAILLSAFTLSFMVIEKNQIDVPFLYSKFVTTAIPLTLIFLATIYVIANKIHFGILEWIGKISFSIYLFHMILYRGIDLVFKIEKNSFFELLIFAVCFPVFLYACRQLETLGEKISLAFKDKILIGIADQST